ncbi:class I SAM-dependent methyltransferase [Gordonia sp. NPDC003424]
MSTCRACESRNLVRVLDLGSVPPADQFPPIDRPVSTDEAAHPLAMDLCSSCGLAQLAEDDTVTDEPRGVEPQALRDQAREAIADVAAAGWLRGSTVREFGSPHGGTWVPLLQERGFIETEVADVVLDCFGIMHDADQRDAFARRAAATAPGGVLLVQFHSLATIVREGQWNALRHGHFAYYSMPALADLLSAAGMTPVAVWEYGLYGGSILVAAVHGGSDTGRDVRALITRESGMTDPAMVGELQGIANRHVNQLRLWLEEEQRADRRVFAYGAASRAVSLFCLAGLDRSLVHGVADASPGKQGRRMPGTDIPIISPTELVERMPDRVLLTVPDLYPEVDRNFPALAGRWFVDDTDEGAKPVGD